MMTHAAATFDKPWQYGWMAHNGGRYSLAGRNFQSQGLLATRFVNPIKGVLIKPGEPRGCRGAKQ